MSRGRTWITSRRCACKFAREVESTGSVPRTWVIFLGTVDQNLDDCCDIGHCRAEAVQDNAAPGSTRPRNKDRSVERGRSYVAVVVWARTVRAGKFSRHDLRRELLSGPERHSLP